MRSLAAALAFSSFSLTALTALAEPVDYTFDGSHSNVGFSVSHLVVSTVKGRFKEVQSAVIKLDEADLTKSKATIDIKAASINTDDAKRDEHLRSPDFFDTKKFPVIKFDSTKWVKSGKGYKVTGNLTIRGVAKPVTLDATVSQPIKTPFGTTIRGVTLAGKIDRTAYGLTWNKALEAGGLAVGNEVTLDVHAELVRNEPKVAAAAPPPPAPAKPATAPASTTKPAAAPPAPPKPAAPPASKPATAPASTTKPAAAPAKPAAPPAKPAAPPAKPAAPPAKPAAPPAQK